MSLSLPGVRLAGALLVAGLTGLTATTAAVTRSPPGAVEPAGALPAGGLPGPPVPGCGWRAPVSAAVSDPFRLPDGPYGPGNRGVEYATGPDQSVTAVAAGRVELAGVVAGRRWVVVAHDHDLRSTYGPLASSTVEAGQAVGPGQVLGFTAGPLLLTARLADRYVDPAPLLAGHCGRLRLVATPAPAGPPPG